MKEFGFYSLAPTSLDLACRQGSVPELAKWKVAKGEQREVGDSSAESAPCPSQRFLWGLSTVLQSSPSTARPPLFFPLFEMIAVVESGS